MMMNNVERLLMRVFTDRNSALKPSEWLMNDIFHVRTLQRLGERMVWLEPFLFHLLCKEQDLG
jgi:hypothetical protein